MKQLAAAVRRFLEMLAGMDSRTALRPAEVPVRK